MSVPTPCGARRVTPATPTSKPPTPNCRVIGTTSPTSAGSSTTTTHSAPAAHTRRHHGRDGAAYVSARHQPSPPTPDRCRGRWPMPSPGPIHYRLAAAKADANPNPLGRFRADTTRGPRGPRGLPALAVPCAFGGRLLPTHPPGGPVPTGSRSTPPPARPTRRGDLDNGPAGRGDLQGVGNRRAAVCESCAEIYRADAYQLVAAGMKGGKGVPETVAGHPAVFATTTAPGFGSVHTTRTTKKGKPAPCRARKTPNLCAHGVDLRCMARIRTATSSSDGRCVGTVTTTTTTPCGTSRGELWRRTTIEAGRTPGPVRPPPRPRHRRLNPATGRRRWAKTPARISFGKCADSRRAAWSTSTSWPASTASTPTTRTVVPPPAWANQFLLMWILRQEAVHRPGSTPTPGRR